MTYYHWSGAKEWGSPVGPEDQPTGTRVTDPHTGQEVVNVGTAEWPVWVTPVPAAATVFYAQDFEGADPLADWSITGATISPAAAHTGSNGLDLANGNAYVAAYVFQGAMTASQILGFRFDARLVDLDIYEWLTLGYDDEANGGYYALVALGTDYADGAYTHYLRVVSRYVDTPENPGQPWTKVSFAFPGDPQAWHTYEIVYDLSGAQPVATLSIDGAQVVQFADSNDGRTLQPARFPGRLDFEASGLTLHVDNVSIADGQQGV